MSKHRTKPSDSFQLSLPSLNALQRISCLTTDQRDELRERLHSLSFVGYEHLVRHLLMKMGYTDVRLTGRRHLRGRRTVGGYDLVATSETGITHVGLIVMVKQYRRVIQRRFHDELQGAMQRVNSRHGMLITTSSFSKTLIASLPAKQATTIDLIDGERLMNLLERYQVGVVPTGNSSWAIDRLFFDRLNALYPRRISLRETNVSRPKPGVTPAKDQSVQPTPQARMWQRIAEQTKGGQLTWRTHILTGISSLWLLEPIPHVLNADSIGPLIIFAAFGSLLPDLDAPQSKLQSLTVGGIRPFRPIGVATSRAFKHRGPLHSVAGLGIAAILSAGLGLFWGFGPASALWLGYASHVLADSSTKSGVPVAFGAKRLHLLPPRLRFVTGSLAESILLPFLVGAVLLLILVHFPIQK